MDKITNRKIRRTTLRIPDSLVKDVEKLAKADNRSFNQMINILVEKGLSQDSVSEVLNGPSNT